MKKFNFIFLVVFSVFFIFSCQKEEIDKGTSKNFESQSTFLPPEDSPCGEINELCREPFAEAEEQTVKLMSLMPPGVGGGNANEIFHIFHLTPKIGTREFLVESQYRRFILTNSQDGYVASKKVESQESIPSGLYKLFDAPSSYFDDGELSSNEVTNLFDSGFTVSNSLGGVINVTQSTIDDGNPPNALIGFSIDWCEWVMIKTVKAYEEHIMAGLEDYIAGSSTIQLWNEKMEKAIRECESDPCTKCPDSRCVMTTFANDPSIIGAGLKNEIYVEYLELLLGLTEEQKDWLLDNPDILSSFLDDYNLFLLGVDDRADDCIAGNCGVTKADRLYIELLMEGEELSSEDRANLEIFYSTLFCEDPELYDMLDFVLIEYVNGCIDETEILQCFEDEFVVNYSVEEASPVRFAVSAYRICKRAYKLYKRLKKNNNLTLQKFKDGLFDEGIDELLSIADDLYTVFGPSFTGWDRVLAAISFVSGLDLNTKNAISQKVTQWGNQSVGSYYLGNFRKKSDDSFGGIYVGKGSEQRMKKSIIENSNDNRYNLPSYHEGSGVHSKSYFEPGVDKSIRGAAEKEEMIIMWDEGWIPGVPLQSQPAKFYNERTSPGFTKINADGF